MIKTRSEWLAANRANWDERVSIHLASQSYDLAPLRAGLGHLHTIEEAELGSVKGLRILHLQCHFGRDTLTLAQRGAEVIGLDFSGPAITAARGLADEIGLSPRARFVQADLYQSCEAIPAPSAFDLVFMTWGTLVWLADINRWAEIVAHFLKPGGSLYLADGHPCAYVFDDATRQSNGMLPGWHVSYFQRQPMVIDDPRDYADDTARLKNERTYQWMHPLGEIVSALISAGLSLSWLREHDCVPWRMFGCLVKTDDGMFRWPENRWLPLAFSLRAIRPRT
jgi:SAM-dependent methyltransferase